jgi:hypothetical protein
VSLPKYFPFGALLCVVVCPGSILAQEGARLSVVVLDPSNAAVPSAKVTLIQRSRGSARSAETEVTGNCYFGSLNPGAYRLEVEKQGFDKYVIGGRGPDRHCHGNHGERALFHRSALQRA